MTYTATMAAAAVKVAATLGVHGTDPVILADGANVIVHLRPAPYARLTAELDPEPAQPLHGDAGAWRAVI